MLATLKNHWRRFRQGKPGRRFQDRFEENQRTRSDKSAFVRFGKPLLGIALLAAGLVFCVIPGPGVPILLVGAGLLSDQWRGMARTMDWLEIKARRVVDFGIRWWNRIPAGAKYAVILLAVIVIGGAAYGGYRFLATR